MPGTWGAGFRARIFGKINGQVTNTVLHFAVPTVTWDGTLEGLNTVLKQLANAIHDCILTTLIPAMSSGWQYERVEVSQIAPTISDPISNDDAQVTAGTAGDQGINTGTQVVALRSGIGGRNGRGRMLLPPAGENVATAGQWTAPQIALVAAFCACMATKFVGPSKSTNFTLGVLSRTIYNNAPGNLAAAFHAVATLTPDPVIGTLARRKMGRGV